MKKIYNLLMFVAVAMAFTACHPLDNSYKELDANPTPVAPKTVSYTVAANDYALLDKNSNPFKNNYFATTDEAKASIPTILRTRIANAVNGTIANVTTPISTVYNSVGFKPADSLFNNVIYTVTADDYTNAASTVGTTFKSYSNAQVLLFLKWKYPTPVANQLSILTYTYFESGVTPSAGVLATDAFVYTGGAWVKGYFITPAQYTLIGRGNFGNFGSADNANIPAFLNTILKADANLMATAKVGDLKYVSYKYFASSTNSQRVQPLRFDGTNWVTTKITVTTNTVQTYSRVNNVWVGDNSVYYTLVDADYTYISNLTFGTAAMRSNLGNFKNFDIRATGGATNWPAADVTGALTALVKYKFATATPAPVLNQIFTLTYVVYDGATYSKTIKFKFNGTDFEITQ